MKASIRSAPPRPPAFRPANATAISSSTRATRRQRTWKSVRAREADEATYPDIDLKAEKREGRFRFFKKSGEPYE